ncbi:MAG: EAL domain-containing protein [Burkholderiaceae bacterium]
MMNSSEKQYLQRIRELERQLEEKERDLRETNAALEIARQTVTQNAASQEKTQAALNDFLIDYRATFDLAAIGIAHLTPEGRWIRMNAFLCEMLGYSAEELQQKTFQEVTYADDLHADLQRITDLIDGNIPSYAMEKRYVRKDGTVIWGHLTVSLVRDELGHPKYFISIVKDIDRRVRASAAMERSRARLQAVLNSLSEGVIVFSNAGQVLEINPAAMRLFGYPDSTSVHANTDELDAIFEVSDLNGAPVTPENWPVSQLLSGEPVSARELIIRRRDAMSAWIASISGFIVKEAQGANFLAVLTVRDITQRHQAETALRLSEERLRLAFDHIPDMVVIYDPALRIQYANVTTVQAIGRDKAQLVGRTVDDIDPPPLIAMWQPLLHAALQSATTQADDIDFASEGGLRNYAVTCVPICESTGRVREVLAICHDYTERRQAEEKVRLAALHDALTGLPNRTLLFEYARHIFAGVKRTRDNVCVMFIDLDRFKPINDIHGHEVGDAVLRQVAARLRDGVRGDDTVFRIGGDEFLVLLPHCTSDTAGEQAARHLMDALCHPFYVGSLELSLSCSIGLSVYPRDGTDLDTLINCADAAMYVAKETGRRNLKFYTPALAERVVTQSLIEQRIKQALGQNEFCLHYQPVVDMHTNDVVSVEALLRWPTYQASPERFIQVAELTGLIGRLGEWVMSAACQQQTAWKKQGLPTIPIAVNVSSIEFRKADFDAYVGSIISRYKVNPAGIHIELTETAVMQDIDHAITVLGNLQNKGMRVSLDDFGTGYSSLNYLSRLPLNKIKIDQSFVRRLGDDTASRAIIEAIIALGRTLGLEIVAEGVESEWVLGYLRSHGCHQAQGYYVCPPLSGNDFVEWFRKHTH